MLLKLGATCVLAALVAASPIVERAVNPTVTIASGVLIGTATSASNQPSVTGLASAFLGVPFAASPTRFSSPVAPTSWATKTVQTLRPACYQAFTPAAASSPAAKYFENPFGPLPIPESEDCLHLNVYVPPNTNVNSKKTVMFWLYGGNLAIGANYVQGYNGSSLAVNNDVIVVVPNYRVNFFGFSGSPDIPVNKTNSGFLDQRFALQWVQNNIKAFGGDPNSVTIFGESAGAYSVKQLLAQPPSPRGFNAAIMESSGFGGGSPLDAWNKVVAKFCSNKPATQTNLQCVQAVPASTLRAFIADSNNKIQWSPVVDSTFVASNTLPELRSGQFADVPLLIGSNLNEATIFAQMAGLNDSSPIADSVRQITGLDISSVIGKSGSLFPSLSGFQLISRIATDLAFTCTSSLFATAVATNSSSPVWRYRYDGDFPNTRFFPGARAYHSSEIPEVFGTYPYGPTEYSPSQGATSDQIALSSYMQKAWATFAKNPAGGPQPGTWTQFIKPFDLNHIGVLGSSNKTAGLDLQDAFWTDYSCLIYGPLLILANYAF